MTEGRRPRVSVWAPAKINLGLEVVGKRSDGYHELVTIFQTLRLGDRVEIELRRHRAVEVEIRPSGLDLGPVESNLVARAARTLLSAPSGPAGDSSRMGVWIRLTKRIPVGAGLGGGSSDAAATLIGLAHLLGLEGRPIPDLFPLARSLGADVPFFLQGGTRLGRGVGDLLQRVPPWPRKPMVLVFPNVSVSTSSVFRKLETGLTPPGPLARMAGLGIPQDLWESDWSGLRNDLESIVSAEHAEVREILEEFRRLGSGFARMSGSGSAVFGLAGTDAQAREWVGSFRARGHWAREVRPARSGCRLQQTGAG